MLKFPFIYFDPQEIVSIIDSFMCHTYDVFKTRQSREKLIYFRRKILIKYIYYKY